MVFFRKKCFTNHWIGECALQGALQSCITLYVCGWSCVENYAHDEDDLDAQEAQFENNFVYI